MLTKNVERMWKYKKLKKKKGIGNFYNLEVTSPFFYVSNTVLHFNRTGEMPVLWLSGSMNRNPTVEITVL